MPTTSITSGQTVTLAIADMTCGHCVASVERALGTVRGIAGARVSISVATLTLEGSSAERDRVVRAATEAIEKAGYPVSPATADAGPTPAPASCCCAPRPQQISRRNAVEPPPMNISREEPT
jgi:copper chaperone CopZ